VPNYINKFNKQKEEAIDRRKREEEEAKIPPGTR
jgi:hypothetical protein